MHYSGRDVLRRHLCCCCHSRAAVSPVCLFLLVADPDRSRVTTIFLLVQCLCLHHGVNAQSWVDWHCLFVSECVSQAAEGKPMYPTTPCVHRSGRAGGVYRHGQDISHTTRSGAHNAYMLHSSTTHNHSWNKGHAIWHHMWPLYITTMG